MSRAERICEWLDVVIDVIAEMWMELGFLALAIAIVINAP